jgi:trans-2,3-dihydro-3-hydroxyanthranilate isomerase
VIADVFTDVALEGNPVAVFTDGSGLSAELMQRTARELNLSETVFVLDGDDGAHARVRIFTPSTELPFAGHPVLGTAFVLGEGSDADVIRLQTNASLVPVALRREGGRLVFGEMEQPMPEVVPFERTDELLSALGVESAALPIEAYTNGPTFVYVALEDDGAVAALEPDLRALAELGTIGISCFTPAGNAVKARVFAPGMGVAEDPATGSAAGPLAVHLLRHGALELGQPIDIRQGAEIGRPSLLRARLEGSAGRVERVVVGGSAVIVARGEYQLP